MYFIGTNFTYDEFSHRGPEIYNAKFNTEIAQSGIAKKLIQYFCFLERK